MTSVVTPKEINALFATAFPKESGGIVVREVGDGFAKLEMEAKSWMLRPGNKTNGPAQFTMADVSTYAALFTKVGIIVEAVTSNININFLRSCEPGPIVGECTLIKLGKRTAIGEVNIRGVSQKEIASHAIVTFSYPSRESASE